VGRISAQHLVRTDSRDQKLDAFLMTRGSAAQWSGMSAVSTADAEDFLASSVTDKVSMFQQRL